MLPRELMSLLCQVSFLLLLFSNALMQMSFCSYWPLDRRIYLFQCSIYVVTGRRNVFRLTDSVDAVKRLLLEHWIPLRFHQEYMVCGCQVEAIHMV